MIRAVVKEHVRAKYHQAACSGSRVIVCTEKKLGRTQYSPSLPRGKCKNNVITDTVTAVLAVRAELQLVLAEEERTLSTSNVT